MPAMYRYKVAKSASKRGTETGSLIRARQIRDKKGYLYRIYEKEPGGKWKVHK